MLTDTQNDFRKPQSGSCLQHYNIDTSKNSKSKQILFHGTKTDKEKGDESEVKRGGFVPFGGNKLG